MYPQQQNQDQDLQKLLTAAARSCKTMRHVAEQLRECGLPHLAVLLECTSNDLRKRAAELFDDTQPISVV